jgi:hypothetical protein
MKHKVCTHQKLEDLVPSRSTCEELKKSGFPQETYFHWSQLGNGLWDPVHWEPRVPLRQLAAPTLGELMEELERGGNEVQLITANAINPNDRITWYVRSDNCSLAATTTPYSSWDAFHTNPAEAAAKVFLARAKEVRGAPADQ